MNELFTVAAAARASDLHLIVGQPPMLRIDGELAAIGQRATLTRDAMEFRGFNKVS